MGGYSARRREAERFLRGRASGFVSQNHGERLSDNGEWLTQNHGEQLLRITASVWLLRIWASEWFLRIRASGVTQNHGARWGCSNWRRPLFFSILVRGSSYKLLSAINPFVCFVSCWWWYRLLCLWGFFLCELNGEKGGRRQARNIASDCTRGELWLFIHTCNVTHTQPVSVGYRASKCSRDVQADWFICCGLFWSEKKKKWQKSMEGFFGGVMLVRRVENYLYCTCKVVFFLFFAVISPLYVHELFIIIFFFGRQAVGERENEQEAWMEGTRARKMSNVEACMILMWISARW